MVGKTASGNLITGIAKYGKSETPFGSTNVLRVHYPDYPPEQTKDGCFVGGNLVPLKNGCAYIILSIVEYCLIESLEFLNSFDDL